MWSLVFLALGLAEGVFRREDNQLASGRTVGIAAGLAFGSSMVASVIGSDPLGFGGLPGILLSGVSMTAFFLFGSWAARIGRWFWAARLAENQPGRGPGA